MPYQRDFCLLSGMSASSNENIDYLLSTPLTNSKDSGARGDHRTSGSQAAVIVVGGIHEMLDSRPGSFRLTLRHRRGYARKALEHGADLVPIFSFGENDIIKQVANPVGRCNLILEF